MICTAQPCDRYGYPTLRDMCLDHYRDLVYQPAWDNYCRAEEIMLRCQDDVYRVEQANGQRANLAAEVIDRRDERRKRFMKAVNADPPKSLKRSVLKQIIVEDDDGEITNDI